MVFNEKVASVTSAIPVRWICCCLLVSGSVGGGQRRGCVWIAQLLTLGTPLPSASACFCTSLRIVFTPRFGFDSGTQNGAGDAMRTLHSVSDKGMGRNQPARGPQV